MSRGQSQSRNQPGRRVLGRCKTIENIEIIDVDKDKTDVVIIDTPETSRQGSRGPRASGRHCWPSGIISIDDEEGEADDNPGNAQGDGDDNLRNAQGDADDSLRNAMGDPTRKVFCPASSNSPISEESQSDECLVYVKKRDVSKPVEYMRTNHNVGSSTNRFGLGFTFESSNSESDKTEYDSSEAFQNICCESAGSDCEIIEDSAGDIREQWERAALRRKTSYRCRVSSEDRASASGSSADPGSLSEETTQSKINVENCTNTVDLNHLEEEMSAGSSPHNSNKGKKSFSFNMPASDEFTESFLDTKMNDCVSNANPTCGIHHRETSFQKEENVSKTCSDGAPTTYEGYSKNKRASCRDPEAVPGLSSCDSKVQHDNVGKEDGVSSVNEDEQVAMKTSFVTDGLLGATRFQDKSGPCVGKSSPCIAQPWDGKQVPHNISNYDKEEPSFFTQSEFCSVVPPETGSFQEKGKSVLEERSFDDFRDPEIVPGLFSRHSKMPHDNNGKDDGISSFNKDEGVAIMETSLATDGVPGASRNQDKLGHSVGKSSPCNAQFWDGKQVSPDNISSCDKKEPSFFTQSQNFSVIPPEIADIQEKENSDFGEQCFRDIELSQRPQHNADGEDSLEEPIVCNSHAGSRITDNIVSSPMRSEDMPQLHNDLACAREKHKESEEYRLATEEEWASRQRQLQIQAVEAQRLRRRRKAECLRVIDMEKRQKQRLEEIRESQKKDEETINLKEQLRAEVRKDLDKMELIYRDMASLLRGLGVRVEGGSYPTPREVNVAYKQALLRFHPDRASRSDIRQQVQAEETFKLISRLKEKLLL